MSLWTLRSRSGYGTATKKPSLSVCSRVVCFQFSSPPRPRWDLNEEISMCEDCMADRVLRAARRPRSAGFPRMGGRLRGGIQETLHSPLARISSPHTALTQHEHCVWPRLFCVAPRLVPPL